MRLLNVETLQLEVFDGGPRVTFAILSHTWGDEEVTFQDMMSLPFQEDQQRQQHKAIESKRGFSKILSCCAKARREGYRYVWIDTCCIDKSSSAELSEAINSMFKWYHEAEVCYAFLSDVSVSASSGGDKMTEFDIAEYGPGPTGRLKRSLHRSRWFTRGWTLQELVAPLEVVFVDCDWVELGTRETLAETISEITGIDGAILRMERSLAEFSIAQRMSWASSRNTTRIEDEAYCLMGLFDVSMPLLYGEGRKAFKRLQLEIMRQSTDRSILAWASPDSHGVIEGVLASSPAMFEDCGGIRWNPPPSSSSFQGGVGDHSSGSANRRHDNKNLNHNACHDIIGFSLKMEAGVLEPPATAPLVFREYWDFADEHSGDTSSEPHNSGTRGDDHPLADLVHFPRDVGELYTHARAFREFDYGFLRHKSRTVVLIMLDGCTKRGGGGGAGGSSNHSNNSNSRPEYTVGITLCSDTDGLMKRVHFPSRFLIPNHTRTLLFDTGNDTDRIRTIHASLSGTEVLQQPILPNFAKCMVRVPSLSDLPYTMAYTVPSMAGSSSGVWYLERWGTIPDLASLDLQPCFSLHRTGSGRAMVFHHGQDLNLSFGIIFTLVKEGRGNPTKAPAPPPPSSATTDTAPLSRQSTCPSSVNSLTSSTSSLTSTFSRTVTNNSADTNVSSKSPSSSSFSTSIPSKHGLQNQNPNPSATLRTHQTVVTQKQWFAVTFISGPEALNLRLEADLAPFLPPSSSTTQTTTKPIYSYTFELPDPTLSLSVKIRKAPKVSNAGGKNYNALLGFEYRKQQ